MLLGYARGKVGSLVFSRRKGEQITRARNFHPANPRTLAQMSQRMKMYAPVALYKATLASNFKYAFQDQRANESAFNAFIRRNIAIAPWVNKTLASQLAPIPFPALVSDGSLQSVDAFVGGIAEQINSQFETIHWGTALLGLEGLDQMTVSEVSLALIAKYPSLQYGDMLTFITINAQGLSVEGGDVLFNGVDTLQYKTAQFTLSETDSTIVDDLGFVPAWPTDEAENAPKGFALIGGDGQFDTDDVVSAGAIIVTRKSGSNVIVSTERLQLNAFATEVYNLMSTDAYRQSAAQSYLVQESPLLDPSKV